MMKHILQLAIGVTVLTASQQSYANEEYKKEAAERQRICDAQKVIRDLSADISTTATGEVMISWKRMTVPEAVQFQIPPGKRHPKETWIALDGNAQTNGRKLNESWFKSLEIQDVPEWTFRGVSEGDHSVLVAHKSDCGTWNMKGVSFTIPGSDEEFEEVSYEISDEEAEDLSFSANLGRYGSCMVGGFTRVKGAWSIVRRNGRTFVTNWVKSPLRVVMHPVCLIRATGGLETPPDPDQGVPNCFPQIGMLSGCEPEWVTFYQSDDGTEALSRMGNGYNQDDTARVSCLATVYIKYNEHGRDLDRVFDDPFVISQGCNKSRPR